MTDLARAYFELLALDQQLEISDRTVKVREESLKLVQARFDYGWDSQTPVLMTENLLYGARAVVPELKRTIEQKENQISTLLGRNPGGIKRGKPLLKQDLTVIRAPGTALFSPGAASRHPLCRREPGGGQCPHR